MLETDRLFVFFLFVHGISTKSRRSFPSRNNRLWVLCQRKFQVSGNIFFGKAFYAGSILFRILKVGVGMVYSRSNPEFFGSRFGIV